MIERAKRGRVIVLTTHSMEEADVLGDRIGIMSQGRFQALGTSVHLKKRFGSGFKLTALKNLDGVCTKEEARDLNSRIIRWFTRDIDKIVEERVKGDLETPLFSVNISDENSVIFNLKRLADSSVYVTIFKIIEEHMGAIGIRDFTIGLSTLEEVFLNLSNHDDEMDIERMMNNGKASKQTKPSAYETESSLVQSVAIPEGKAAGDHFTFEASDGRTIKVTVPEGMKTGDEINVGVPSSENGETATASNKQKVTKRYPAPEDPSCCQKCCFQTAALFFKSWTYQTRQSVMCTILILFPILIMLVLLIVDQVVLGPAITRSVCGTGVAREDCSSSRCGPNATRYQIQFSTTFDTSLDQISMGDTCDRGDNDRRTRRRFRDAVCGDQIVDYNIPIVYTGSDPSEALPNINRQLSTNETIIFSGLVKWHSDMLYLASNDTCNVTASEARLALANRYNVEYKISTGSSSIFGGGGATASTCVNGSKVSEDEIVNGTCLNLTTLSALSQQKKEDYCDELQAIDDQEIACGVNVNSTILAHFSSTSTSSYFPSSVFGSGFDLSDGIGQISGLVKEKSLGMSYSAQTIREPIFSDFAEKMIGSNEFVSALASNALTCALTIDPLLNEFQNAEKYFPSTTDLRYECGVNPDLNTTAAPFTIPSNPILFLTNPSLIESLLKVAVPLLQRANVDIMNAFCLSPTTEACLHAVLRDSGFMDPSSSGVARGLCAYVNNLDVVRNLRFTATVPNNTRASLDAHLWDAWGKQRVMPVISESYPQYHSKNPMRHGFFQAPYTSIILNEARWSQGKFDYAMYMNETAVEYDNAFVIATLMSNAIHTNEMPGSVRTNRKIKTSIRNYPGFYDCDNDAWAEAISNASTVRERFAARSMKLRCPAFLTGVLSRNLLDFVGPIIFPYFFLLYMWVIMNLIVYEKEVKLRMYMKMMGLTTFVYYFVAYIFYLFQYLLMILLLWIAGVLIRVQFFTLHSPAIIFITLFLWGNTLIAFSFLLSTLFKSRRAVASISLLILLVSVETGSVLFEEFLNAEGNDGTAENVLMIWPPWVMSRIVYFIGTMSVYGEPITSSNWLTIKNGIIPTCLLWMLGHWVLDLLLLWYLDSVVPSGNGVPQHPCCCFLCCCKKKYDADAGKDADPEIDESDTSAEAMSTREMLAEKKRVYAYDPSVDNGERSMSTRILNLGKNFKNFKAVRHLTLGVNANECLGVLGSNGAGKSTTISTLVGLHKPSYGEAMVGSYRITRDMGKIQERQGVCTQDNILWEELTGEEHIKFFGKLKGLSGAALESEVKTCLEEVSLYKFRKRKAGAYSGGMKRRLSVACSLIGSPKVVYLDEPSTGLDPASKRKLWDVVANAKGDKSIVLTTHSMEEADNLCDRLAVMSHGKLQCIGTSLTLKRRYGIGYTFSVMVSRDKLIGKYAAWSDEDATSVPLLLRDFLKKIFPQSKVLSYFNGKIKLEVPREDVVLSTVFEKMEDENAKHVIGVVDWAIVETNLEEVFLKLCREAAKKGLEASRGSKVARKGLKKALKKERRENDGDIEMQKVTPLVLTNK